MVADNELRIKESGVEELVGCGSCNNRSIFFIDDNYEVFRRINENLHYS